MNAIETIIEIGRMILRTKAKRFKNGKFSKHGCWTWRKGACQRYVKTSGGELIHRKMFRLVHGKIPKGKYVCHHCDNPKCIRPDHLFAGTPKQNTHDAINKGRLTMLTLHGEKKRHKLTSAQIAQIRALASCGVVQTKIAKKFGINQSHVSLIVRNKIRKDG